MMTMVVCPYQEAGCTFYVSSILFVGPEDPEQSLLRKGIEIDFKYSKGLAIGISALVVILKDYILLNSTVSW